MPCSLRTRHLVVRRRDDLVAVVGGAVLVVLGAWWSLQAARSQAPADVPDGSGLKALFFLGFGLLAVALGVLARRVRASSPRPARRLVALGRMVVVGVACLYVVGVLALGVDSSGL